MSRNAPTRRAQRLSRPDSHRWLTVMVVLSHRTFRWSLTQRTLLWILGGAVSFWFLGVLGSGYGWWATKKIMSFSHLRQETVDQQAQLRATLGQAKDLEAQIEELRRQQSELMKALDPRAQPDLPKAPATSHPGQGGPANPIDTRRVSELQQHLDHANQQAGQMASRLAPILSAWAHTPSVLPTAGYFSSGFGVRIDPFANSQGEGRFLEGHTGIDISNELNTPIQVTADGTVVHAGWMEGYGNAVIVQHTDQLETLYGHMNEIKVKVGQTVSRGDILGLMGHSGRATGTHLHYEVRVDGRPVNPVPYLKLQRQWLKEIS
ncbi:MAG TPA: M23 family metallopeptidase [Holophagaceae bacterium]|nr:M23 family metallopeptidase [Holophagaceae bacterium]